MRIWSPIVLAPVVGATVPPRDTIVSIESSNGDVNVRRLPDMLRKAGHTPDKEVAFFLKTAVIMNLKLVHLQVVKTSASTVDSDTLCNFVTEASRKLSLQAECAEDVSGGTLGDFDSELHVNDPIAYWQNHFKWMKMGEVWQAALPRVIRRPTVAVLDSGINWADPDFAPLKGRVKKTSGGYLKGGWNFNTESSNLTTESSHGTHVCKVLAAKGNNSYGLVGVAPDVSLMPLQVVKVVKGKDTVPLVNFVAALNMAIDIKADIISMSVGFYPTMTPSLTWPCT